ncbi:S8 family peptidase [Alkalibacterium pelagium]|uniref:Serine protease, subtilisin family n=1 Tax=Alkalibacterium pelagium TaxID=426702 RepID=A0A1H7JAN1_9LACT|nr:S8 family peptidase [Alkalibacterium pelagium]GEN50209.1 hypothetical protein APE02nite_08740 [Alkalibacterium pelagium]SEK71404.1 Serine protease, subtilisin family [Alkalibacterium pelagium]
MNKKRVMLWRAACAVVLVLGILLPATSALAHDRHHSDEYIDIIVRYSGEVPSEEDLDPEFKNVRTMTLLPVQTMSVPASSIKDISQMENVERITYDQEMHTTSTSHSFPVQADDWNQDMIGTFNAWEEGITGESVRVAVLDTGFYEHGDIEYAGGYSIFEDDPDEPDYWTNDHDGHGTHVASIIGANQGSRAQGVAPGVDLYGVKVYHQRDGSRTNASNLLAGLQWAINEGMDVISISSGYSTKSQEIHDLIQLADQQGILVVAASGNISENKNIIDYPAAHPEVIAVANVDQNGYRVSDSMISAENELAAPGRQILGLGIDGPDSFRTMSGTSQATPHVAGIAALLMQKYPGESAGQIRARMAEKARDLGDEGRDPIYGYGLVHYLPEQMEEPEEDVEEDPTEEDDTESDSDDDTETEDDMTDEDTDENGNGEEQDPEEIDDTESPQDDLEDDSSPEEEPTEDQDSEDSQDDASDADEEDEAEEEEPLQSTVWIRPSDTNGMAVIDDEDLEAVADNGLLAISFDSSLEYIERVSLTPEQVESIRSRNITLLIARIDMEWVIPSANLTEGEAFLSFETVQEPLDYSETAHSDLIDFSIEQNDQMITAFPEQMTYRFFTEQAEANQHQLYEWNTAQEEWILLGDTYTNSAVVGETASVATMAVFDPIELEAAILSSEEPEDELEEIEDVTEEPEEESEEDETEESTRASFGDGDSELPVVLVGGLVILTSVGGGFYFFGGKPKQ